MCHVRMGLRQNWLKIRNLMREIGLEKVISVLKNQGESLLDTKVWESRPLTAQPAEFAMRSTMGNGICSRKQRKIFQTLLLITVGFGVIYGTMMSYETHKQLKRTEAMALKYQQHQESLSAQLQVVYEHRSRLEKSLQKERLEHKKAKDDYLLFKLEAQQSLNKEKQDAQSKFNSLHSQHQMLKNQHEDLKKQFYELQDQHQTQGQDHSKVMDENQQRFDLLQETKELEISKLKENVYNLREENKQLRKAHQEIHVQLQDTRQQHKDLKAAHEQLVLTLEDHKSALAAAQFQVDEYKHLKETKEKENKMARLRQPAERQEPTAGLHNQPAGHEALPARHQAAEARHNDVKPEGRVVEVARVEERRPQGADERVEANPHQHEKVQDNDPEHNLPDENAVERKRIVGQRAEQQEEKQRLAEEKQRLAEEHRQQALGQDGLPLEHEEALRLQQEGEEQQRREAELREQQLRDDQLRNRHGYNLDSDIVHENNDLKVHEAEVEAEGNDPPEEEQRFVEEQHAHLDQHHVEAEVDPADDPNNQGEDEFEEAEQQVHEEEADEEPVVPGHADVHSVHGPRSPADEQLVIAGNPDQQEDNLEEQYQEEGDDEAQEELAEEHKAEEAGEEETDPYNEENGEQDAREQEEVGPDDRQPAKEPNEEENYEEEEEEEPEEDGHHRAEM